MSFYTHPACFTFRPGDTSGTQGVYTTWPALITALSKVFTPAIVRVDDRLAPAHVPTGLWSTNGDIILVGCQAKTPPVTQLIFDDGAKIAPGSFIEVRNFLHLISQSNSPVVQITGPFSGTAGAFYLRTGSEIIAEGTAPFIDIAGPSAHIAIFMDEGAALLNANVEPVNLSADGAFVIFRAGDAVQIPDDTISGVANTSVSIQKVSSSGNISRTQSNFAGNLFIQNLDLAARINSQSLMVTSAYAVDPDVTLVLGDVTGGSFTVTLPLAAIEDGREIIVKKIDGTGNTLTIAAQGGETIEGVPSIDLTGLAFQFYRFMASIATGTPTWYITGQ